MSTVTEKIAIVLAKDRNPSPEQEALQDRLLGDLERRPELDVTVIPHLYDLAPEGPGIRFLRSVPGDMILLSWLYPRSAFWVLDANGVAGRLGRTTSLHEGDTAGAQSLPRGHHSNGNRTIWCFDLRTHNNAEPYLEEIRRIVQAKQRDLAAAREADGKARVLDEATRPRWYPVVDRDRCNECQDCLNFCLFGVFGVDDNDGLTIEQPDACRPGCPACARVCPNGAIMFPQHVDPAIAGDPSIEPGGLKLDLSQLFAGVDPLKAAAAERAKALAEKQKEEQEKNNKNGQKPDDSLDHLIDDVEKLDL